MKSKLISDEIERTYALIFDKGDEVSLGLLRFARENNLAASQLTAIGAFESVTLGFFDRERKDYARIEIGEQVEVLALVGDITLNDDSAPQVHAHVVVGNCDGTAHGGHLLGAVVWPTLEVIVTELPHQLQRRFDKEAGLIVERISCR